MRLSDETLAAIDEALEGFVVEGPRLAPFAKEGVKHR